MTPKSLIEPARHAGTALLRSQSDARLVDLTRDGNERAFEAIVERYRRPLLRYCSRLLPLSRAEDAVQQAFLSAHRAIHAGDAELNLRPWLYRIAHNAALNLLRQNGFDHDQVSEEIDGVETPPQAFERGERLRTVVAAVQELPERQRNAIVLQAVEGRSYDEIAAELGVSDGAVRQLLNRARNTLREAAAAITPAGLLTRMASSGGEAGVVERIAQAVAGAGGGALVAKAGAALVVAGAVAGGAVTGGLPGSVERHGRDATAAQAAATSSGGTAAGAAAGAPGDPGSHLRLVSDRRSTGHGRGSNGSQGANANSRGGGSSGNSGSNGDHSGSSGGAGSHGGQADDHSGTSGNGSDDSGSGSPSSGKGSGSGDNGPSAADDSGSHGSGGGSPDSGTSGGGGADDTPASDPVSSPTPSSATATDDPTVDDHHGGHGMSTSGPH